MKHKPCQIIATLNSHKIEKDFILKLYASGATLFRLNGVHVKLGDIAQSVKLIREFVGNKVRILVDLPGNKIRTNNIYQNITLKMNEHFELGAANFNFRSFIDYLEKGDIILSSDGQLRMTVLKKCGERIILKALTNGEILNNKGMHLPTKSLSHMPFLFEKDMQIIDQCKQCDVDLIGFSFVRHPDNMKEAFNAISQSNLTPLFKLETREATDEKCLGAILDRGHSFLIDRGDLVSEVGIVRFPKIFNHIVDRVKKRKKELFVATQLFASMYNHNVPFISEVMEFHRLVKMGISGFQLSEEIAIGLYPFEVLKLMKDIISEAGT